MIDMKPDQLRRKRIDAPFLCSLQTGTRQRGFCPRSNQACSALVETSPKTAFPDAVLESKILSGRVFRLLRLGWKDGCQQASCQ
jgi:hypothetical protein